MTSNKKVDIMENIYDEHIAIGSQWYSQQLTNDVSFIEIAKAAKQSKDISDRRFDKNLGIGYSSLEYRDEGRSTKKLYPIHGAISACLSEHLSQNLFPISYGYPYEKNPGDINEGGYELKLTGPFTSKKVDIAIASREIHPYTKAGRLAKKPTYKYNPVGCIFSKILWANVSQNKGNYSDNFRGDTSNLRRAGYIVGQFAIIAHHPIYHYKDGSIGRKETVRGKDLQRYLTLDCADIKDYERPEEICIIIVDIDEHNNISKSDVDTLEFETQSDKDHYLEISNIDRFVTGIAKRCNAK
jgi:hypothetical protein